MLSNQKIYPTLAQHFIGVRLDWEQGNHFKDRFGFILGTGDQMILDPAGNVIPPQQPGSNGKPTVLFGRHGVDITPEILEGILARFPRTTDQAALNLDWFFWTTKASRRSGGSYPVSRDAIAGFTRLPIATVSGPIPKALGTPSFLQRHVRQFIWVRGPADGPARLVISRVKDGLAPGLDTRLADVDPSDLGGAELGRVLDQAWLSYMKDRPRVAEGYLDNPHGGWMRGVRDIMVYEDEEVRQRARLGTLQPPGRSAEAK